MTTNSSSGEGLHKDLDATVTADAATTSDVDESIDHDERQFRCVRRGEALPEASSSQETIAGYDAELMSDRTLLSVEEEKKLLRRIDWRLMTLCSLLFMFKNLDSQNVRAIHEPALPMMTMPNNPFRQLTPES